MRPVEAGRERSGGSITEIPCFVCGEMGLQLQKRQALIGMGQARNVIPLMITSGRVLPMSIGPDRVRSMSYYPRGNRDQDQGRDRQCGRTA